MPLLIPLLAVRDGDMDGVTEYCNSLRRELPKHGFDVQLAGVPWDKIGWPRALWNLFRESAAWRGKWVLLQYTALGWSRRGFPLGAVAVSAILRRRGARCALVFHEPYRQAPGSRRWIDRVRGACQDWVVRSLHIRAEKSIFADPLDKIS